MAEPIKGKEVIEDNHLDNPIKSAKDFVKAYKKIDEIVLKVTKDIVNMNKAAAGGQTAKGIQEINKALISSTNARKSSIVVDKEKLALDKQLLAADRASVKAKLKLQLANQRQRKELKDIIILEDKEASVTEKLLAKNRQLSRERDKLSGATKKEARQIKALNKVIDSNNAKIDKNADKMKKQRRGIGDYSKAVGGLRNGLAQLGLAFGVFSLIKDSFNVIKDFDQAQANLSSVLGVTREEMGALTEQAKLLGETTKFTASQVSELQLEYAKLGFTQKEIDNVTESTLQLAAAAGTELANAATIVGSTLRAFGLDTSETQRLVDVMAKSFSASSLDIDKFSSAMANVAPAAKSMGFSIEKTTALIGTLTDSGIDASAAGTGLRNMFLDSLKQGIDFADALDQINNSTNKLKTSFDIFGKKGSVLGVILAENQQATAKLTSTLENAGGAAEEMADKQLDTLGGAIELLKSAWEGLILKFNEGSGAGDFLKNVIKFLAENLVEIVSIVVKATVVFGFYKLGVIALKIQTKLLTSETNKLGKASTKMGKALGGPLLAAIGAVVLIVISLIDAYVNARREGDSLVDATAKINEEMDKEEVQLKAVFRALAKTTRGTKEREEALDDVNKSYGLTLSNLETEADFVNQLFVAYQKLIVQLRERIALRVVEEDLISLQLKQRQLLRDVKKESTLDNVERIEALQDLEFVTGEITILENELLRLQQQKIANEGELGKGASDFLTIKEKELELEKKIKKEKGKKLKTQAELDEQAFADILRQNAENLLILENQAIKDGKKRSEIDKILTARILINIRIQNDAALRLFGEFSIQYLEANLALNKALNEQDEEARDKTAENNKTLFDDILAQNEENLTILETALIKQGKSRSEIDKILKEKRLEQLENERDESLRIFGIGSEKFLDADNAFNKALLAQREQANKDQLKAQQEAAKKVVDIFKDIADSKIEQIEREIEAKQGEISASEEEVQRLRAIGTANAAEAIKAEKVGQAQDKIAIKELERKKKNLLITVAGLERVSQLIGSGNQTPFKTAGGEMSGFLESLKGFDAGTDTTIADAMGKPHLNTKKDGYIARLGGDEMVMSTKKSLALQKAGIGTTNDVFANAMKWQNRGMMHNAMVVPVDKGFTDKAIINELKANTKAIENIEIPVTEFDMKNLIKTIRDGKGNIKRTHYDNPDLSL